MYMLIAMTMSGAIQPLKCEAPVVIVISRESTPYQTAANAVADSLSMTAEVMTLDQFKNNCGFLPGIRYVGVGPAAASYLASQAPVENDVSFCMLPSVERAGLAQHPRLRGVVTAVSTRSQLDLIRASLPEVTRISVLHRSESQASLEALSLLIEAAGSDFEIITTDLSEYSSVSAGITEMLSQNPDIVWTFPDPMVFDAASVKSLLISSIRAGVPVFGFSAGFVRAGALLGIDIDSKTQGEHLAEMLKIPHHEFADADDQLQPSNNTARIQTTELRYAVNLLVSSKLNIPLPNSVIENAAIRFD